MDTAVVGRGEQLADSILAQKAAVQVHRRSQPVAVMNAHMFDPSKLSMASRGERRERERCASTWTLIGDLAPVRLDHLL